jgi:phage portal protein BeeE
LFNQLRSWLARRIAPTTQPAEQREKGMTGGTRQLLPFPPRLKPVKKYSRPSDLDQDDAPKERSKRALEHGLQGKGMFGWTSDHREESEQFQGWVAIALAAVGKAAAESTPTVVRQIPPDDDSGGQELDEKPVPWRHPLVQLLRRPNKAYDWSGLAKRIVIQRGLTGSAYIWAMRSKEDGPDGPPCALYVIPTALVNTVPANEQYPEGGYRVTASALLASYGLGWMGASASASLASWYVIDARHVIRLSNYHPMTEGDGLSPLHANRRNVDVATETEELIWSILQNGAFPAGILSMAADSAANSNMIEAALEKAKAWIEAEFGGPERAGKIMPVYGMTYQQLTIALDSVKAELRTQNRDNVLATYGVSPVVAGYQDGGSYSANHAAKQQFVDNVAQPEFTEIAGMLSLHLADEWGEDLTIRIDAKPVNDQEFDLRKIESKANLQLYTVDEIRAMHGDGPHPDSAVGRLAPGAVVPYYQSAIQMEQQQAMQAAMPAPADPNAVADPNADPTAQQALPAGDGAADTQGGQLPQFPAQTDPNRQGMPTAALDELAGYSNRLKGYDWEADAFPPVADPFAYRNGVHANGKH